MTGAFTGSYALGVFSVCLAVGIAGAVCYGRESVCRPALSVLVLYAVALPLLSMNPPTLDGIIGELPDGGFASEGEYLKVAEQALEKGLSKAIMLEYSLSEEEVTVAVKGFELSSASAEEVTVILKRRGVLLDPERVRKFVEEIGDWRCRVEFEI